MRALMQLAEWWITLTFKQLGWYSNFSAWFILTQKGKL
jgi:hypothetical protein